MTAKSSARLPQRSKPRRTSSELTPITDEEIFGAAGMNGSQINFLRNIPPEQAASARQVVVVAETQSAEAMGTDPTATDAVGSERVGTAYVPARSVPINRASPEPSSIAAAVHRATEGMAIEPVGVEPLPTQHVPTVSVPTKSLGTLEVPTSILCGSHPSQRRIPILCTTAEQGHTRTEQLVYEFLWKAAAKWGRRETPDARLLRFKQPWLASILNIHENSVRSVLHSLTRKFAIEETAKAGPAQGREVRVYSAAAVLERRKQHGLVWAVRSHGVRLLTAEEVCSMKDPGLSIGTDIVGTPTLEEVLSSESVGTETLETAKLV